MVEVALALGSNLGDRAANLSRAVDLISEVLSVRAVSSVYETEPMYVEDQPWFLNCAVVAETEMPPRALLDFLEGVTSRMGRRREIPFGPRVIDIDILLYDALVVSEPGLDVPHPRMADRAFVLLPLAEVAPQLVHPVLGRTVSQLLAGLKTSKRVKRLGPLRTSGA